MSSSRARNFRRRGGEDDDDAPHNEDVKVTTKSTTPAPKPKPKKLLSFADDEDSPIPSRSTATASSSSSSKRSTKLSSSSHKVTSRTDRQAHSSSASVASNVQPQAGIYTKEALLELQKNTRTLAPSRPASAEPAIVLKGLLKPSSSSSSSDHDRPAISQTLKQNDDESEDDEEEQNRERRDAQTRFASLGIGKPKDSSIPDQATIDAIRAKRERLRKSRAAAPDYISLDGGSNHGEAEGLSDEEPEFRGRIAMFGDKKKTESEDPKKTKKGVFEDNDGDETAMGVHFAKDSENGDEDEDEEEKIWEEEQVRKGLGKRMDDGTSRVPVTAAVPPVHSVPGHKSVYPATVPSLVGAANVGSSIGASQGWDTSMSVPQQAELAMKALQENVKRLKESHGRTIMSLTKTDDDLSASLSNISSLEMSLSAANEKFIFMQKLRHFVSVICDFLQDKAPYIEELEEQMQKLNEERTSAILERRAADNDDELMEVEAAVSAAMSVFSQRGSSAEMIAAARAAAQAASVAVREQTNLPVKLDEFGRDVNLQKRMDMTRRAERRKARFDSKRISSMDVDSRNQRIEGESSSDESDSESTAYQHHRKLLLQTADQIFSDAAEEYSQLSAVKERFEKWKRDYSSSYRDAYMSLSVPAIFSPYVRLELLKWDPLHEDVDFFDMKWHSLLFDYGSPANGIDFASDDADANLVPELVEKVALPILHHEIAHCWDILSTRETKNAVTATSLVINYVPASRLSDLLAAIRTCLAKAIANITVPTWSPLVLKAVPGAARVAAYRFGMSVRLLRNICLWKDVLALQVLEKLALDELLCGIVLPHVRSIATNVHDAITRTERIVAALSGVWTGPNVTGGRSHRLQPLVDFVLLLGKTLEKKQAMGITDSETGGLARRLKKMLVELNEYDNARDLAKTFHLKEAL